LKNFIQNKPKGFQNEHTMVFFWEWDAIDFDLERKSFFKYKLSINGKKYFVIQKNTCAFTHCKILIS